MTNIYDYIRQYLHDDDPLSAGMVVPVDQVPFLIESPHLQMPEHPFTIASKSELLFPDYSSGNPLWAYRFYYDEDHFLQVGIVGNKLHEARYFQLNARLDVTDENRDLWLGEKEGIIGWKQFFNSNTGITFDRLWFRDTYPSGQADRFPPIPILEQPKGFLNRDPRQLTMMMYAREWPENPAAPFEYALVSHVLDPVDNTEFVEVHFGIDVNEKMITIH